MLKTFTAILLCCVSASISYAQPVPLEPQPIFILCHREGGTEGYFFFAVYQQNLQNHTDCSSLEDYLKQHADKQIDLVSTVCKLSDQQKKSLSAALTYENSVLIARATKLVTSWNNDLANLKTNPGPLYELGATIRRGYFADGTLARKVLETILDDQQKHQLHEDCLQRSIEQLTRRLELDFTKLTKIYVAVRRLARDKCEYIFEVPQYYSILMEYKERVQSYQRQDYPREELWPMAAEAERLYMTSRLP